MRDFIILKREKLSKINPSIKFIQLLLVFFFLLLTEIGTPQEDVFLGVDIPIYPGATDIRYYNENANKTIDLSRVLIR